MDNEGFTFLSRESLDIADQNFLKDIYLNQTIFLKKYSALNQINQPFIFVQQLDQYSNQAIIITINQGSTFYNSSIFFKISLVDENNACQKKNTISGFKANGKLFTYTSDSGTNYIRRFVFYQKSPTSPSPYCFSGNCQNLLNYGNQSNNGMIIPSSFFYTTEIYMGANGMNMLSTCNQYRNAFAFGLK